MCPTIGSIEVADPDGFRALRFPAAAGSAAQLRHEIAATLDGWGRPELIDDATLCAGELACNAILHGRGPFEVTLRPAGAGVRIEVIDSRPDEPPSPVPFSGTAADITRAATTGRGLLIVATVAQRWGFTVTTTAKSVWAEVVAGSGLDTSDPVVVIDRDAVADAPIQVRLLAMPVRAAVMSGVQVDELVREIQLRPETAFADANEQETFFDLLDGSAHPRLSGRYAALRAASLGQTRFDVDMATTVDAMEAVNRLAGMLSVIPERLSVPAAKVRQDVSEFREWLAREVAAQVGGARPTVCDLPA